jgi:putative ABC transport system permease protein
MNFINPRWRKVLRDLWGNKSRTFLVVASISIGVIAFGGLFVTRYLMLENLDEQYQQSNPYDISISLPPFQDEVVRWAARQPNVTGAEGVTLYTADMYIEGQKFDLALHAFSDYSDIQINRVLPQTGTWPPERGQLLIERSFIQRTGLQIGDDVIVETSTGKKRRFEIAGTVYDINVQPGTFDSEVQAYVNPRTLYDLNLSADYNTLYVTVNRPVFSFLGPSLNQISDQLRREMDRLDIPVYNIRTNSTGEHFLADTLNGLVTVLVVVGTLSLILSAFLVFNTISGFLIQQKKQIGIMKIIGASRAQIVGVYLVMVSSFGALALVIALPISMVVARGLSTMLGTQLNVSINRFEMPLYILALQIAVAFLAPILSALYPILNATSISPARAISDHSGVAKNNLTDIILSRIRSLPRPLLLSIRNVFRSRLRLVMTMITLVLAGAFFITVLNVRQAIRISLNDFLGMANFDIRLSLDTPYSTQISDHLLSIPGVVRVEGDLSQSVSQVLEDGSEGGNFQLYGLRYDSEFVDPPVHEGRWLEPLDRINRYDLVVTTELANTENIAYGDVLTLKLNGEEQEWQVVGIVRAMIPAAYTYYDSVSRFAYLSDKTNSLVIRTTEDSEEFQAATADAISQYLDDRDIEVSEVELRGSFVRSMLGGFDTVIFLLLFTSVLIAVVGGLGLAGTMSMSVMERVREIGVMRSVGAGTNTLRFMFIAEGVFIGIMSSIIALILSIPLTGSFAEVLGSAMFGWAFPSTLTLTGPILWVIIALGIATLASLAPAQRASQISIREALAYE